MKVKDRLLRELEALSPQSLMKVYDLVISLKEQDRTYSKRRTNQGHLRTRRALKNCVGSFSDDIWDERNERL